MILKRAALVGAIVCAFCANTHAQSGTTPGVSHDGSAKADTFVDPLDAAAPRYASLAGRPIMSMAHAGTRLVGVGMRGLIAFSDDDGKTWQQAADPVSSDLIAVTFPDASAGWAVGHDGVVLHSADGGRTWTKQLDGRMAATLLTGDYAKRIAAGEVSLQPYVDQLRLDYKAGPALPLLDVWFRDRNYGVAIGPFGIAIATEDGGRQWRPLLDRIDDPQFLHLNAIAEVGNGVMIAAERGTVFRLNPASGRFEAVATGYSGTFFTLTAHDDQCVAGGLKGTLYRSTDRGTSWRPLRSPLHANVTAAAWWPAREAFVFVTAAGEIALMNASSGEFRMLRGAHPGVLTGVLPLTGDALELVGLDGASRFVVR